MEIITKVYVVSSGDYDDYRIKGIFSTKEAADEFKTKYDCDRTEEYKLNPANIEEGESKWNL